MYHDMSDRGRGEGQHVVAGVLVVDDPLPGLAPLDHQLDQVLAHAGRGRHTCSTTKVLDWPKRCKLAHAFMWE
jgi:hypothetical protein